MPAIAGAAPVAANAPMTIPGTAIAVASFRALPLIPIYDLPMYVRV